MSPSITIVAYLALFASVGLIFVFVNLLLGRFLRPVNPHPEKLEIYECGEPTIGSSFVQFDLRFYVVALVFIVFDVEVAFMFPWATVYGKAHHLMDEQLAPVVATEAGGLALSKDAHGILRELGNRNPTLSGMTDAVEAEAKIRNGAKQLAWYSTITMGFFFFVLFLGFAYEWKTGAMDWVRAIGDEGPTIANQPGPTSSGSEDETLLTV